VTAPEQRRDQPKCALGKRDRETFEEVKELGEDDLIQI
jgi:hypothetical protein